MTAAASAKAVRSAQDETRYPPPSCSAFHGLCGSRECEVTTCGTLSSLPPISPAKFAYQVWEWITSTSPMAFAMATSAPSTRSAGLAPGG